MGRFKDITGKKFNRLVAVEYAGSSCWLFLCKCGSEKVIRTQFVVDNKVKSCGCLHLERCSNGLNSTKHGHTKLNTRSPEHSVWAGIIKRTTNPEFKYYSRYGGRGIKVCTRWEKFKNFLDDMGPKPEGMTIERIDNDGDYEPGNCCWATRKDQARNRVSNRLLTVDGVTKPMASWCEELNLNYGKVCMRINKLKWSTKKALELE